MTNLCRRTSAFTVVGVLLLSLFSASRARANVYATNLKLNEGSGNVAVAQGTPVAISYILNEEATLGVTVEFRSGATLVRTVELAAGQPGTYPGTNTIEWDGNITAGTYTVSVTARSSGHTNWTQLTDDSNLGNHVYEGRGIAVNRNPASPYYGRIYVGNAHVGNDPASVLGDAVGISKLNADASVAYEGGFSDGGYAWAGDYFSPWKVKVGADDRVYIEDFTGSGVIFSWDATISSETNLVVFRSDNYPYLDPQFAGMAVVTSGTDTFLYAADSILTAPSAGIVRYRLTSGGYVATNDIGTTVVATGGSLDWAPYDVALDASGNIYTIQNRAGTGDPSPRVMRFDASSFSSSAATNAAWVVGEGDDNMGRASGIAVDPTGTYVAVAFQGILPAGVSLNGCTQVFYATNGALAAAIDLGVNIGGETKHEDTDVAWDAVGNLYYIDNWMAVWRAVSPPGTNAATTTALQTVQITGGGTSETVPITGVEKTSNAIVITFTGNASDTPSTFTVVGAAEVVGPYAAVAATITAVGSGVFTATVPDSSYQFFKVTRASSPPITGDLQISSISVVSGTVTLLFTGKTTDSASAFTVLSAASVEGPYAAAAATVVQNGVAGSFRATLPASGTARFYRISKP